MPPAGAAHGRRPARRESTTSSRGAVRSSCRLRATTSAQLASFLPAPEKLRNRRSRRASWPRRAAGCSRRARAAALLAAGRAGTGRPSLRGRAGLRQRAPRPMRGENATTGGLVSTPLCRAATNTTGNSSPLAECTVITLTAAAESSGGASGSRGLASRSSASSSHEFVERHARRRVARLRQKLVDVGGAARAGFRPVAAIVDGRQQQPVEGDVFAPRAPFAAAARGSGSSVCVIGAVEPAPPSGAAPSARAPRLSPMARVAAAHRRETPTSGERSTAARRDLIPRIGDDAQQVAPGRSPRGNRKSRARGSRRTGCRLRRKRR